MNYQSTKLNLSASNWSYLMLIKQIFTSSQLLLPHFFTCLSIRNLNFWDWWEYDHLYLLEFKQYYSFQNLVVIDFRVFCEHCPLSKPRQLLYWISFHKLCCLIKITPQHLQQNRLVHESPISCCLRLSLRQKCVLTL